MEEDDLLEQRKAELLARRNELMKGTATSAILETSRAADSRRVTPQTAQPQSKDGGGIVEGIAAGAVRAPAQALGGTLDLAQDAGSVVGNGLFWLDDTFFRNTLGKGAIQLNRFVGNSPVGRAYKSLDADADGKSDFGRVLSGKDNFGKIGNDVANNLTTEVGSVMIGFGGARALASKSGVLKASDTGLKRVGKEAALAGAGGQVLDPEAERLSNLAQQLGFEDGLGMVDFLAASEDKSVVSNRLGLFFEEGSVGLIADGVFGLWKVVRGSRSGTKELVEEGEKEVREALGRELGLEGEAPPPTSVEITTGSVEDAVTQSLDEDFAALRAREAARSGDDAVEEATEEATSQGADTGSRSSPSKTQDTPGTVRQKVGLEGTPDPQVRPEVNKTQFVTDFNAAFKKLGLDEELTEETLEFAGGRVVVSDEAAEAFRLAGASRSVVGRSAAENLPKASDTVVFRAVDGPVAGTMSRSDLEQMSADIKARADGVVDPTDTQRALDTGEQSLVKYGTPEGLQATMRGVLGTLGPVKGVRNDEDLALTVRATADKLFGGDATLARAWAEQLATEAGDLDIAVKTLETFWVRASKEVDSLDLEGIAKMGAEELREVGRKVHNVLTFAHQQSRVGTGLGRALRVRRTMDADSYIAAVGDEQAQALAMAARQQDPNFPAVPISREEIIDWVDTFKSTADEPSMRNAFLQDNIRLPNAAGYFGNSFVHLFTGNILTAPYTFLMNVVAPTGVGALRTVEKMTGSIAVAAGRTVTGDLAGAGKSLARASDAALGYKIATVQAFSTFNNIAKGLLGKDLSTKTLGGRNAAGILQSTSNGRSVLGSGNSIFDVQDNLRISPQLRDAAGAGRIARTGYAMGNAINFLPRQYRKMNVALDEIANRISYTGEQAVILMEQARAKGLTGRGVKDYVDRKLPDILDNEFAARDTDSLRQAQRTTLTATPGTPNARSSQFISAVNAARKDWPLFRVLLPIFNVPVNGVGETMRRIPGLNFAFKESREELLGKKGPRLQEEAYGRMMAATSFLVAGVSLSQSGLLTGSGPSDPRARQRWLEAGNQPWSIRFSQDGDWIDVSRYDIAGTILGITGDLFDRSVYTDDADEQRNLALAAVGSVAEYFRDRSALQTLVDVIGVTEDGPNSVTGMEARVKRIAASTVVPNFVTALGRNLTDEQMRDPRTLSEMIYNKLPFASKKVSPRMNSLGEPVHIPRDTIVENAAPVLISPSISYQDDPAMNELLRMYEATGAYPGISSPRDLGRGEFDPRDIDLSEEIEGGYNMFNEFLWRRGQVKDPETGLTLREALMETIDSEEYGEARDADASRTNLIDGGVSRGKMLSKLFSTYTTLAKQDLAKASPTAARYLAAAKIKQGSSVAVEQLKASEIVEDPTLLEALDVDFDAYVSEQKGE